MITRRKLMSAVLTAGTLTSFALVAGTHGEGSGNNGNPCNGHGKADECHGNGAKKDVENESGNNGNPCNGHGNADECHGNGAKKDVENESGCTSSARMSSDQTPPPACRSAARKEDHVE